MEPTNISSFPWDWKPLGVRWAGNQISPRIERDRKAGQGYVRVINAEASALGHEVVALPFNLVRIGAEEYDLEIRVFLHRQETGELEVCGQFPGCCPEFYTQKKIAR